MSAANQNPPVTSLMREERQRQGLSLRQLAYFTGTSHVTIRRLELGDPGVAPAVKVQVARALRVPLQELFKPEPIDEEPGP